MSAYDSTVALMANKYALRHVQREIRLERVLSVFSRKHRRILAVLVEHEQILTAREPRLGKRRAHVEP